MNIDRRQLALPVLAIGLLGVVPAFAVVADERCGCEERRGLPRGSVRPPTPKRWTGLCRAGTQLQSLRRKGSRTRRPFVANATDGKSKFLVAGLPGREWSAWSATPPSCGSTGWAKTQARGPMARKSATNLHILMELAKNRARTGKLLDPAHQPSSDPDRPAGHGLIHGGRRTACSPAVATPHGPNLGAGVWLKSGSSATQVKVRRNAGAAASPVTFATLGKTQSGPGSSGPRAACPLTNLVATIRVRRPRPPSTQLTSGGGAPSKRVGAGPTGAVEHPRAP